MQVDLKNLSLEELNERLEIAEMNADDAEWCVVSGTQRGHCNCWYCEEVRDYLESVKAEIASRN